MTAPQITALILCAISSLVNAHMQGKQRELNYNFFVSLTSVILNLLLLYWGGFFK